MKRSFSAQAVSICRMVCAAYFGTPPRHPLIPLPGQKILASEMETNRFTTGISGWKLTMIINREDEDEGTRYNG